VTSGYQDVWKGVREEGRGERHRSFVFDEDRKTVAEPDHQPRHDRGSELHLGKLDILTLGTLLAARLHSSG
jgi:hypothetical protein